MRDYDIESDLKQEKFQSLKLVQGDRGNKIKINVYEDGQPVNLAGCSVTAKYKRADGEIINDGVIENIHDNSFDAVMDSSITKVAGTLKMLFTIEKDAVKVSAFLLLADVREGIGESSSSGGSAGGGEVTVDLSDYYKKIETYSRKEIDAQFKDIVNKTITTEERSKLSSLENYDDTSVKNDIQTQKARIDTFTSLKEGSTTGDAELIDARIGVNGTNYSNLGDSIRSQLDYIVDISPNLYEFNDNGLYTESGITNANTKYWHSKPIACKIGDVFRISKRVSWQSSWIGVLDKNGNKIDTLSDGNLTPWLQKGDDSVNYDTITISEFNYNGAIVNKDNIGFLIISFSAYDSVTDSSKNIIVKNCDFPEQFIEKGSTLQSCVKFNEIHKKSIQNISDEQIREFNKPIKKALVLLNFDAFNFDDKRFEILQEYGFKATVTFGTQTTPVYNEEKANKYKKVMSNGWDIGIYSATNWVKDKYGNEAFTSTSDEVEKAWEDYVKLALEDAELNGVYYPQTWFCRQNAYCDALGKSLRKYGFKMCRGEHFVDYKKTPTYFNNDYSFVTRTKGLYPSTVEGCLWEIDQCVNDTKGISIFSHGIYATDEEAESNFGCTETNLRTVLDRIKKYVDEGKLEVLTYNELYNRYNLNDSININYNRILKMLTNN
jgi:hypothetical protein